MGLCFLSGFGPEGMKLALLFLHIFQLRIFRLWLCIENLKSSFYSFCTAFLWTFSGIFHWHTPHLVNKPKELRRKLVGSRILSDFRGMEGNHCWNPLSCHWMWSRKRVYMLLLNKNSLDWCTEWVMSSCYRNRSFSWEHTPAERKCPDYIWSFWDRRPSDRQSPIACGPMRSEGPEGRVYFSMSSFKF